MRKAALAGRRNWRVIREGEAVTESGFVAVVFSAIFASLVLGACISEVLLRPLYWRKKCYQLRGDYALLVMKSKQQEKANDECPIADDMVGPDHQTIARVNVRGITMPEDFMSDKRIVFDEPSDEWPLPSDSTVEDEGERGREWSCAKCEGGLPSVYTYNDKPLCTDCANKMRFGGMGGDSHYAVQGLTISDYNGGDQ